MDVPSMMYADPALMETIVGELKSQGTFDQFRKECIADVDTKPAYQNLHQRVETAVSNFLEGKTWRPDLNKNQLRDSLRKHIHEMGFLETGVERIVDQVVNPKVHAVFMPQVEDVVYRVQGIPKPEKKPATNSSSAVGSASKTGGVFNAGLFNQPPPFLHGLSFLPPALQNHMQKPPTLADLLPTDLDPVSPESSKDSADVGENETMPKESGLVKHHDDSMESQLSGISDLTSHGSDLDQSVKSETNNEEANNEDVNDDSHLSKVSSNSKLSCESIENKSNKIEDFNSTATNIVDHNEVNQELEHSYEDANEKSTYPSGSVMHYGDQFTVEEEVATTTNNPHEEVPCESSVKEEPSFLEIDKEICSNNILPEDDKLKSGHYFDNGNSECTPSVQLGLGVMDDYSLAQSEDSQLSGSSDNKLQIDEMKDFNSQSENSHQQEDEQNSMKTSSEGFLSEESYKEKVVENIVEASEEARHGFEDSQDALERPPLPQTPSAVQNTEDRPPLPPDSSPEAEERPIAPPTPPCATRQDEQQTPPPPPTGPCNNATDRPQTPPLPQSLGSSPLPFTSGTEASEVEQPPPLPLTESTERPPLPPTPPLAERLKALERPPLPPTPPSAEILDTPGQPPLPPTPPIAERLENLERPPTPQAIASTRTPPPVPEEEFSRDSNVSPTYDEGAIPKTPRWEPRSPGVEDGRPAFSSLEFLGMSDPSETRQSFIPSSKASMNGPDEESQSGSEDMQLAWSPLSTQGDEANEDSSGKHAIGELDDNPPEKIDPAVVSCKVSSFQEKPKEVKDYGSERHRESKKDDRHKSDSDKHRDCGKDGKSKERRKEDDRPHKDSSSSSKRHDDRSSKHRDRSRDRRDNSSRSKHDDKNRSDKDRERHSSSHHRSDDKRRDEKRDDKDKSSKHKSSRSDDRHRHRDRERRNSSSRHEDRSHEKSFKSEDRAKSSLKSHSNDRDRRYLDRRDRDSKDKEKKFDKDKDRSKRDLSRNNEKKREKEREKSRRDKSSNICRPNNERKSPDPDSNNGSTFGGNNHTPTGSAGKDDQHKDGSNQDSNKGSGSTDSNSKSSESSQQNNSCVEVPSISSSSTNQPCPSSSLPFKKRPLIPESDSRQELSYGLLILNIKKLKSSEKVQDARTRKMKAIRRLEKKLIRNWDNCPRSLPKAISEAESPPPNDVSPTEYFETDWPTKSDDKAFLAFIQDLEQNKNLSGLSDFSQSDSEDEEILHVDDSKSYYGLDDRNVMLSLSVLTEDEALKLSESNFGTSNTKGKVTQEKLLEVKPSNSTKAKNRSRQRKQPNEENEVKRRKVTIKEIDDPVPSEQKSRRARKPNKRYSNDEFTSHFEDEIEFAEEKHEVVPSRNAIQEENRSSVVCESQSSTASNNDSDKARLLTSPNIDHQEKENKVNLQNTNASSFASKPTYNQSKQSTYTWNRDSYNSNSEDEMDNTNNENDLIGTALKNLMMESGLGGPDEASGSQKLSSTTRPSLSNSLSGVNKKTIPLSGVKRVGLSKNFKRSKNFAAKPSVSAMSSGEFSLPPSPESDVSASSCDKASGRKLHQGNSADIANSVINSDPIRKLDVGRFKQHYSSDDLYKPRPPSRLTSKRRQAASDQNSLL